MIRKAGIAFVSHIATGGNRPLCRPALPYEFVDVGPEDDLTPCETCSTVYKPTDEDVAEAIMATLAAMESAHG
jgi:hypothetical protein